MINGNVGGVALKFKQENPTDMDLQEQLEMILTRNVAERQNTANAIVEVIKQTASHGNDEEKSLALKIYNETPNLIYHANRQNTAEYNKKMEELGITPMIQTY